MGTEFQLEAMKRGLETDRGGCTKLVYPMPVNCTPENR